MIKIRLLITDYTQATGIKLRIYKFIINVLSVLMNQFFRKQKVNSRIYITKNLWFKSCSYVGSNSTGEFAMPNSRHVATNKNKASKEMLLLALTENRNHLKDLCREIIASFTTQNGNVPELFECESSLLQLETALMAWTECKKDSLSALNPTEFKEGAQQDRLLGPIIARPSYT
ncbi:hypothetical protein CHUAL_011377 [Chamberlinius hualienensis]